MSEEQRTVCWFSCGVPSALAAKIALSRWQNVIVARIVLDNEHEDNNRFCQEVAIWLGCEITLLRSDEYKDCWDVWERKRFLGDSRGAPCTTELKKMVRHQFEVVGDRQVFGYTAEEFQRVERFKKNTPEIEVCAPLVEQGLTRRQCFALWRRTGIELPALYKLGYRYNNCIGCVKGGKDYWNQIRIDFPDIFNRMKALEENIGASVIPDTYLKDLRPEQGRRKKPQIPMCGLFCDDEGLPPPPQVRD